MMTKFLQKKSVKLKCPHCKEEIQEVWICEMDSVIGIRYAYICSNCEKLLGISSSKHLNPNLIAAQNENGNTNIFQPST